MRLPSRLRRRLSPLAVALGLGALLAAPRARAGEAVCDSCAACSAALAVPRVRVVLGKDVEAAGEAACVVVRGAGAQLDGLEHTIRAAAGGVAVRVEAAGALVKNLHVEGGAEGIDVAGAPGATLFHDWIDGPSVGVRVARADGLRIERSFVRAKALGVSFGANDDGACPPGARVESPGAVVTRTRIEGAAIGLAACDALPVLSRDEIVRNEIGVVLGAPSPGAGAEERWRAPFDPCACAPELDRVRAGTTLLWSSGCGGCQVHEGWLPELREQKHDVRARETGASAAAASERFDAYSDRCAPALTDVLGIPGCVPNYACVASGAVWKTRRGDRLLDSDGTLASPEDVARFAEACEAAAAIAYRPNGACVRAALVSNVICDSRRLDVRAAPGSPLAGMNDACGRAEGFHDVGAAACAKPCPAELALAARPDPRAERPPVPAAVTPPATALASPAPSSLPSPPAAPPPVAARDPAADPPADGARWLLALGGALAVALGARALVRRRR